MHGGDDRLLVAEDPHGLDVKVVDRQVGRRIVLGARFLLLPCRIVEIGAGAECLALGGENRTADFDIAIEFFQRVRDMVDQGDIEEIKRRLADFDEADMAVLLDADIRECAHVGPSFDQRKPSPRAMMPRKTSVVPPWIVNLGATFIANGNTVSRISWLEASGSTKAARSRTRCGNCCSHTVPMSLTIATSTTGSLPACSMPATDTDMRRMVCTCATSRPMPSAERVSGFLPTARTSSVST